MLRKPEILTGGKVYTTDLLETGQLICTAEMSPYNVKFLWTYRVSCTYLPLHSQHK